MRQTILILLFFLPFVLISQETFRYDTIRVSKDDTRNIHKGTDARYIEAQTSQYSKRTTNESSAKFSLDARKIRYGVNFGLNISDNHSFFKFSPRIGYQFSKLIMAGIGTSYYYAKNRVYHQEERLMYKNNSLGANAFAYVYPLTSIAITIQPELNYIWSSYNGDKSGKFNKQNSLVPSTIIGAGLKLGPAHAMLYYDLVQDINSPHPSGIFYGVSVYF